METKSLNESSYEWLRLLRYNYNEKNSIFNVEDTVSLNSRKSSNHSKKLLSQNRYENFHLTQMQSSIDYSFEYMNLSENLVLTPNTDKSFLNLTNALCSLKIGSIVGPHNSGKRQTLIQLAQVRKRRL